MRPGRRARPSFVRVKQGNGTNSFSNLGYLAGFLDIPRILTSEYLPGQGNYNQLSDDRDSRTRQ